MLVSIRRRRRGADGKGNKPTAHRINFRLCQLAGVSTAKHSVLIFHLFSFLLLRFRLLRRTTCPVVNKEAPQAMPEARANSIAEQRSGTMKVV